MRRLGWRSSSRSRNNHRDGTFRGRSSSPGTDRDRGGEAALAVGGRPSARRGSGGARRGIRASRRSRRRRSSSTSASAAPGTTCAPRARPPSLPLLAKGFFSTEEHLRTARDAGADAALLLLRDLDDAAARRLLAVAAELGLETLVEAHDADELRAGGRARRAGDRDQRARSLHVRIDREEQLRLVASAPRDRVVVAESGIESRAQGAAAELAGADAILVGSTLMRAPDPAAKLAELVSRPLVKVCGLTREEDVAAAAEAGADMAGFVLAEASPRRAPSVLPVPDTLLTVAVVVGEAETDGADLVQLYPREEGKVRGRDAVLLREGEEVARVVDLPWQEDGPGRTSSVRERPRAASCSPAGSARRTCARRSRRCGRGPSTRARASSSRRASRITSASAPTSRRPR